MITNDEINEHYEKLEKALSDDNWREVLDYASSCNVREGLSKTPAEPASCATSPAPNLKPPPYLLTRKTS